MNKMRLLVGGASIVFGCAPAFSQGANPSGTNSNYRGLQNLVNTVNSGQPGSSPAPATGSAGRPGGGHRWKGGGAAGGSALGASNGTGSAIGAGAGSTGAGVDATGKGGNAGMDPAKREERRQRILKRFDTNGDGQLDENEKAKFEAFRAERRAQRQAQMGGGQLGGGGALGNAGAPNGPGGPGGAGGPGPHHKHRDGMPGTANQSTDSQPGLPGGRRGAPGEFPKGFPDGTGGPSTPSNP